MFYNAKAPKNDYLYEEFIYMEKNKLSKFAQVLSELRKERGISQKKAALDLGISQALLSHYEKGIRECGLDFVIKCSEYYGVTTDYILGVSENRNGLSTDYFSDLDAEQGKSVASLSKAVRYLLDLVSVSSSSVAENETIYNYYLLSVYRGALTMAKAGILPTELFKLDYNLAKDLASATIALQDAKFAFIEDKSRTGLGLAENETLKNIIEEAEGVILQNIILEG